MIFIIKLFPIIEKATIPISSIASFENVNIAEKITSIFTVSDFNKILTKDAILPLMIFSILFGLSVKLCGDKANSIKKALIDCSNVMYKMIDFIMYYAPIGLFAYFASFFGSSSEQLVGPIARIVILFYLICIIFCAIFYIIYAYISSGIDGIKALKYLVVPCVTAFATRSSLATVPVDFEAASNMNVPKSVSNLTIPLGSMLFLDGSTLFTVLEISFLFCMFDLPMTGVAFYSTIFIFSVFICILSAGIPTGGMVVEILIITTFNLPIESFPILVLLNFLVDPIVTVVNSTGNIVATMLISRIIKGKGWIFRKELEEDRVLKIYR